MGSLQGVTMVTSSNVEQFNSCKKIFGSLAFLSQSFTG
jgi:receptor tyrosine-protein kinase erbB-2